MENHFRKDSSKFDGANNDSRKLKMKTRLLFMCLGYFLINKNEKYVIEEDKLEHCAARKRYILTCNMLTKEELLITPLEN